MVCHFQSIIQYTTRKRLENDIGAKTFDNENRRILHRFKLRQNAPLGDLFVLNFPCCSNFQNTVSNCVRMHNLATSFSNISQQFQLLKHCFMLRHIARLCDLFFNVSEQFQRPKHCFKQCFGVRMHILASLISKVSLQFKLAKRRLKQRQNAHISVVDLKGFSQKNF